jgi:hypothetical protein
LSSAEGEKRVAELDPDVDIPPGGQLGHLPFAIDIMVSESLVDS